MLILLASACFWHINSESEATQLVDAQTFGFTIPSSLAIALLSSFSTFDSLVFGPLCVLYIARRVWPFLVRDQ